MMNARPIFAAFAAALALAAMVAPVSAGEPAGAPSLLPAHAFIPVSDKCYADWSDAGPIVRAQGLVAVKDVHELARRHRIGDLVKVTLCEEKGRFIYRVVVREPDGRIVALSTDARKPFDR